MAHRRVGHPVDPNSSDGILAASPGWPAVAGHDKSEGGMTWPAFCRDCLSDAAAGEPCPSCGSTRVVAHPELETLSIAHMDCDAFYAAIEKRDDPSLKDKPLSVRGE